MKWLFWISLLNESLKKILKLQFESVCQILHWIKKIYFLIAELCDFYYAFSLLVIFIEHQIIIKKS